VFPYGDSKSTQASIHAQPAPAFELIPQSPVCLGLRGAAFYLTQRPHLPSLDICSLPTVFLSPIVIQRSN